MKVALRLLKILFPAFMLTTSSGFLTSFTTIRNAGPSPFIGGVASWYSQSDRGIRRYTASGEKFDDSKKTCASWDFDFGTRLKVTNLKNGKSVICRVNDRGPSKRLHRVIDLSRAAFDKIADLDHGLIRVRITPLGNF